MHHITVDMLRDSYRALNPKAAPGVDDVTWHKYGEDMENRISELHERVQSGRYCAKPSKRTWIPKRDGRKRPIGIAVLEDKIVQQAMVWVLNQVYEEDFVGFSYGFRPGRRGQSAVLKARAYVQSGKRIPDKGIVYLVWAYLNAGIMDHGVAQRRYQGASQEGDQTSCHGQADG